MPSLTSLLLTTATVIQPLLAANPVHLNPRQLNPYPDDLYLIPTESGKHDGYFYTWWTDKVHKTNYTNLPGGAYSLTWEEGKDGGGNFIGGKGWEGGGNRTIKYSGKIQVDKNGYLAIYGYTRLPLVEWYILDYWGTYNPASSALRLGSVTCGNEGEYDIYRRSPYQQNPPGASGPTRYWSIRKEKRTKGTVMTGCHFEAWEKLGAKLGEHQYQIVAVEGYQSTGSAIVEIESPP